MRSDSLQNHAELGLFQGPDGARLLLKLWENFPEHMFIIRVEGPTDFIIEAINPAQQATLGLSADVVGKRIDEVLPAPSNREVVARYQRCVEHGKPFCDEETGSYFDEDGEEVTGYWLTLLVPLADEAGTVHHLFGISKNISEVYEARARLEAQNRLLEDRVAERTEELAQANRELQLLAARDFLTDCYNRRHLTELARKELERARRYALPFSLVLIDVDEFKQVNDLHGHTAGDKVLKDLATTLKQVIRAPDVLGRYGGDEFLVLMPETDASGAAVIAERLQTAVKESCDLKISIGIGELSATTESLENLIDKADRALMAAKRKTKRSKDPQFSIG